MKLQPTGENGLNTLHFIMLLDMEKLFPDYDNMEIEKLFPLDQDLVNQVTETLILKRLGEYTAIRTKLTLAVKNFNDTENSAIQINMDINFKKNYPVDAEKSQHTLKTNADMSRNSFERKNKRKRKPLKVQQFTSINILTGSVLGLLSSVLCGLSFALKKWSLVRMEKNKNYYFDKNWWMGHSLMMVGDVLHFTAFSFAPAIVVCTLQILTVLVTAVASSKLLGEKLHKYGKIAFALSLGGCWIIVFHVPNEPHIYSINTFIYMISSRIFLIYVSLISIVTALLISYWIPKYGRINSLAYTIQCAIFGSMIVIGLKGIFLGYTDTVFHWLPWLSFLVVGILLTLQLEYLNKALAAYNTLVVTTQYYVLYSACVILSSSLLFKVWKTSSHETIFTNICGLFIIALGALILTIFEETNATFDFSRLFPGPEIKFKLKM